MADTQYGLLVDYTYFSGNHAAEIACKEELGLPLEQFGIKEVEVGPFRKGEGDTGDAWEWFYIPCPTSIFSEHWGAGRRIALDVLWSAGRDVREDAGIRSPDRSVPSLVCDTAGVAAMRRPHLT